MVVGPFQRQRPEQRGEGLWVEGSTTQCLLEGLEVLRVTPPWSEQRNNLSRKRGYERGAEIVFTAWLAVASARR